MEKPNNSILTEIVYTELIINFNADGFASE